MVLPRTPESDERTTGDQIGANHRPSPRNYKLTRTPPLLPGYHLSPPLGKKSIPRKLSPSWGRTRGKFGSATHHEGGLDHPAPMRRPPPARVPLLGYKAYEYRVWISRDIMTKGGGDQASSQRFILISSLAKPFHRASSTVTLLTAPKSQVDSLTCFYLTSMFLCDASRRPGRATKPT